MVTVAGSKRNAITKADIDALGVDATTLDSLDSSQFLRSDADDTQTGTLTLQRAAPTETVPNLKLIGTGSTDQSGITFFSGATKQGSLVSLSNGRIILSNRLGGDIWLDGGTNGLSYDGNTVWHAGNSSAFTTADETKLDGIEAGADVTDATNVSAAGALMKTGGTVTGTVNFNTADLKMDVGDVYMADGMNTYYGTSNDLVIGHNGTQSLIHNSSASLEFESWQDFIFDVNGWEKFKIHGTGVNVTGDITLAGTVDGRDVSADGTKLDGIEAGADVTDTANVTAAGALMDSELTNITAVKAIDQQLTTSSDVEFNSLILAGNLTVNGTTTTVNSNQVNIGDAVILLNSDETGVPSQNAGFEVERGTSANVSFIWNETDDAWDAGGYELQNVVLDGGTY